MDTVGREVSGCASCSARHDRPFDGQQLHEQRDRSNDSNGWATPTSGPPRPWAPMASPRSAWRRLDPIDAARYGDPPGVRADRRCWPNRSPDCIGGTGRSCSASARPPASSWSDGTESRSRSRFSRPATWSVSRRRSAARRSPRPTTPLTSGSTGLVPGQPVPILVAALREDVAHGGPRKHGAIINWLSADNAATVSNIVREENPDAEIAPGCSSPRRRIPVGSIDGQVCRAAT